jgi:hypothetical protein
MTAEDALRAVLAGEVGAMTELGEYTQQQLADAAGATNNLLRASAVATVLARYESGALSLRETQRWAAFLRWGHMPDASQGPLRPIEIDYEAAHEDAIVEALARLDELGDLIDGELRAGEAAELRQALATTSTPRP